MAAAGEEDLLLITENTEREKSTKMQRVPLGMRKLRIFQVFKQSSGSQNL